MPLKFAALALFGAICLSPLPCNAQTALLLAVDDATHLSEVQLAKVMAEDSSVWLSVRAQGRLRLALVTAAADVERAPAAPAWLRALDFATRMRVAAPPGPAAGCGSSEPYELADSGLPDSRPVAAREVSNAASELDLRRLLAGAGLPVEVSQIARFTAEIRPPFQILIYDLPSPGGSTEAMRLIDHGHAMEIPRIELSGESSVPLALITLAPGGVLPLLQESADPSEFPVTYRPANSSSDYLSARAGWLARDTTRWLNEVQASGGLFAWTALPAGGSIEPAVTRYFEEFTGEARGQCETQVLSARARGSVDPADFACGAADDLSHSLAEVGFADLRLSRFFGLAREGGATFEIATRTPRSPFLVATDLDPSACPPAVAIAPNPSNDPWDPRPPPPASTSPVVVSAPDYPGYQTTPTGQPVPSSEESCTASSERSNDSCSGDSSSDASDGDSCSGDSSSNDAGGDSCSGDSSSDDSDDDSCSGDSSSDDAEPDSCSGDASDSKSDSCSGDSDSSSDEDDTCSGNAATRNSQLNEPGPSGRSALSRPRPRKLRLSLLTLLAAAMALPLRRLRAWR